MAKCKYGVKENTKTGTHSCYAVPIPNGLLTFDELVKEAAAKTTYEESVIRASIEEYMKVVQTNALKGFRCQLGKDFLTVYPNITVSVKDYTDKETNKLVVATPAMVTARNAKSRLGCTVNSKFSDLFEREVQWQKVDQTGAAVDEEDINDQNPANDPVTGNDTSGDSNQGGTSQGGNNQNGDDDDDGLDKD